MDKKEIMHEHNMGSFMYSYHKVFDNIRVCLCDSYEWPLIYISPLCILCFLVRQKQKILMPHFSGLADIYWLMAQYNIGYNLLIKKSKFLVVTLFRSITMFYGTDRLNVKNFRKYFVEYCQSQTTLLWIWIMLWCPLFDVFHNPFDLMQLIILCMTFFLLN